MKKIATGGIAALLLQGPVSAQTFETWAPWEVDTVVSAWTLKRFVDPSAEFLSKPKGAPVSGAFSLDTPDSPYKRGARNTAFDEVVRRNALASPCLERLAPIVRTLELSPWRKSAHPESEAFEQGLVPLLPGAPEGSLEPAFHYLDEFCRTGGKR